MGGEGGWMTENHRVKEEKEAYRQPQRDWKAASFQRRRGRSQSLRRALEIKNTRGIKRTIEGAEEVGASGVRDSWRERSFDQKLVSILSLGLLIHRIVGGN